MRLQAVAVTVVVALSAGGCGGADGDPGADPASVLPAEPLLYAEAVARPGAAQRDAASALLERIAGGDGAVDGLLRALEDDQDIDYEQDVEPWLGDRVGVTVGALATEPEVVVAAAVRDEEAVEDFAAKVLSGEKETYRGVEYASGPDGAFGMVDGIFVAGSTDGAFRSAVDAAQERALADAPDYTRVEGELPDERIGLLYAAPATLAGLARTAGGAQGRAVAEALDQSPVAASALVARPDALVIESGGPADASALSFFGFGGRTDLLAGAPGDAATAFGQPDLATIARKVVPLIPGAQAALRERGFDLERDVFAWLDEGMYFDRSQETDDSRLAVVLSTRDRAAARAGVRRLLGDLARAGLPWSRARVPGADSAYLRNTFWIALDGDRVILALGRRQALDALAPEETLEASGRLEQAREALGGVEPAYILDPQTLLPFVGARLPAAQAALVRPYLERIATVALGEDDRRRRYVIQVR